ncbi:hypothetical protein QTP70_034282 [Hemibagrus guttatus]|uniref:Paired domain-containing protein n=1 Tax=Hemibagrus guttatus TaxID=175788 RepID=A0AAE0V6D0_9TELE|nr:hypothetical protein QTP70_034282 [Hemibagrus guttatus]
MGRGSPIPPILWRKIVEQYQKGVSQRKIAKNLKLSSTVHNIIQRFRESGTISVRKGQGRKTILDARDLRALRRHCITYRNVTVMEITTWAQEYFQKTLSKRRRFLWAKAHLKWTVAKWKTVLWSDESKFEVLFGKLGSHVIRTKGDKDNPSCYQRSVQKPASLMSGKTFGPGKPGEERRTWKGNKAGSEEQGEASGGSEEQGEVGDGSEEHGEVSGRSEEQGEASGGSDGHDGKARGSQTTSTAEQKRRATSTAEQEGQATSTTEQQSRATSTAEQQHRATSPDA